MAATHGSSAIIKVADSGATLRDISTFVTSVNHTGPADTADVSTLGSTFKGVISGLRDFSFSLAGIWDPTVDGYLWGRLSTAGAFEIYPAGTATSQVKYTGTAICTSYDVTSDVGDANKWSATFQNSGGSVGRTVL